MNLEPLLHWVTEREAIRRKRLAGEPGPWTKDPILRTYRFCNVRRSDDRVSRWLIDNVLTKDALAFDLTSFLKFSAFCRWVNWPPTIKAIMTAGLYPAKRPDWKRIGQIIDRGRGSLLDGNYSVNMQGKVWTSAYLIPAPKNKMGKGEFVATKCIDLEMSAHMRLIKRALESKRREVVHDALADLHNWGDFMAGQVVADWGYTALLRDATDTYTWAPIGPGSRRGFNRLMGRDIGSRVDEDEYRAALVETRGMIIKRLGNEYRSLTLHDCQNCFCEVDKYLRVKAGEGRPRAKFTPETAF